jgi:hypothetical protein
MNLPAADTGRPYQQRHPDDDCYPAQQGELSVTGHPRTVHGTRALGDPHRPERAKDDTD